MQRLVIAIALAISAVTFSAPAHAQDSTGFSLTLSCGALPLVVDGLLSSHVSAKAENDRLVRRVAKIYAERIDPTETLLTEPEYQQLEKRLYKLVKSVREKDCTEFDKLKKDQISWQKALEKYVRNVASKKLDIDESRELDLDPEKRPRPKNAKEQTELRRALIEFQLANYLASGTKPKEAREKLIHRYELFTKRVTEQDEQDLYGAFLNAYASALDPHSSYMSPDDVADFRIQMELSLTGIGAVLTSRDGYTVVNEIVPGGAADQHGKLKPKDQIIAVAQGPKADPVDVIDMDLREVVKLIRGKKDTKVTLTILRKGADTERLEITIVRDKIDLKEQAAKLRWREVKRGKRTLKLAIIDLPSFYMGNRPGERDSANDVAKLVKQAKAQKADGILLDLSRNGGGALQSAVVIAGLFLESGSVVGVGDKQKKSKPRLLNDPDDGIAWDGSLVVLTSKISASASEILAGTLQDYGRAVVVGDEQTFGKGTVQQLSQLPPGLGLIKVTTALFYLPGGKSTQSIGVPSDVVVPSPFATLEIGERHQKYALSPVSTKRFVSANANTSKSWKPIESGTIKKLAKASAKRIANDDEFKELKKKLAEEDPNETTIKISEILDDSDSSEDEEAEEKDKDKLSIQAREATEILADLVQAQK